MMAELGERAAPYSEAGRVISTNDLPMIYRQGFINLNAFMVSIVHHSGTEELGAIYFSIKYTMLCYAIGDCFDCEGNQESFKRWNNSNTTTMDAHFFPQVARC
jgi:hypothetical protein